MPLIDDVMQRMVARGFRPGPPASEAQVRALEKQAGVLPADYREFLLTFGGGEANAFEAWRGLWRIESVWVWNERYRVPENFPGLLAIGNYAYMLYALHLSDPDRPRMVSLGLSSSLWEDVLTEADSFAEWMDALVPK
jgi:hypothetical protein